MENALPIWRDSGFGMNRFDRFGKRHPLLFHALIFLVGFLLTALVVEPLTRWNPDLVPALGASVAFGFVALLLVHSYRKSRVVTR
jgi:hypothetical protein